MDYTVFMPVLVAFMLSVIMGPVIIPVLRRLKMGQTEREDGVKSHLKKAGTPTMGGVIILLSVVITSVFYMKGHPKIIPILFVTLGFGLIGFLDDYLKVVMRRSDGLFPRQKMALQIVVTAVFAFYVIKFTDVPLAMLIPFSGGAISGYRLAFDSAYVYRSHWHGEWCEFYRWSGWPCFQCDGFGGYIFHGSCYWDEERD